MILDSYQCSSCYFEDKEPSTRIDPSTISPPQHSPLFSGVYAGHRLADVAPGRTNVAGRPHCCSGSIPVATIGDDDFYDVGGGWFFAGRIKGGQHASHPICLTQFSFPFILPPNNSTGLPAGFGGNPRFSAVYLAAVH